MRGRSLLLHKSIPRMQFSVEVDVTILPIPTSTMNHKYNLKSQFVAHYFAAFLRAYNHRIALHVQCLGLTLSIHRTYLRFLDSILKEPLKTTPTYPLPRAFPSAILFAMVQTDRRLAKYTIHSGTSAYRFPTLPAPYNEGSWIRILHEWGD